MHGQYDKAKKGADGLVSLEEYMVLAATHHAPTSSLREAFKASWFSASPTRIELSIQHDCDTNLGGLCTEAHVAHSCCAMFQNNLHPRQFCHRSEAEPPLGGLPSQWLLHTLLKLTTILMTHLCTCCRCLTRMVTAKSACRISCKSSSM